MHYNFYGVDPHDPGWPWYHKLTLPCVSFTEYQQCLADIERDVTPTSLQYWNVHWEDIFWKCFCCYCQYVPSKKCYHSKLCQFKLYRFIAISRDFVFIWAFPLVNGRWELQAENICYKAKEGNYGVLKLRQEGLLRGIMLKHVSGNLTCFAEDPQRTSLWGCSTINKGQKDLRVTTIVTDASNSVVFPADFSNALPHFKVPGFNPNMSEILVFTNLAYPNFFNKGQELRIWYSEDLFHVTAADNGGTHCVNVYTKF